VSAGEYGDETEISRSGAARVLRSRPELRWTDEGGTHAQVIAGRTTVGSAPGAEVRLADREVSRLHAELEPTDQGTWVRDLGSSNGTFVGDLRVTAALLPDGARLRLGRRTRGGGEDRSSQGGRKKISSFHKCCPWRVVGRLTDRCSTYSRERARGASPPAATLARLDAE